jgi:hypothetical protein
MLTLNKIFNIDNNSEPQLFSCFYMCLSVNEQCEQSITYEEAVAKTYVIGDNEDFYASDGDWSIYRSDYEDDDFYPDEISSY